ncbi:hypothetical protein [Brevibacillus massiliensis]|uniref:hypothetical protein n=1 Tax=Brevibacillus massiliensis TaxID=1118054 RepID=UPI0002F62C39|nr:hypothetical protein [Brevibacillus massiliensis]
MEDLLTKLLSFWQVPTIVISIVAISLKVIPSLPVTFLTAQEIEKKIYTKEQRLLHQIIHYLFSMTLVTVFMVPIGDYFTNNTQWYHPSIGLVALIYTIFFFYLIFWMASKRFKITDIVKVRNRGLFLLATVIYLVTTIVLPPYFTGSIIGPMYPEKQEIVSSEYLIMLVLIFFFYSFFIVIMLKPINKVLAFKTEKVVSIEIEKGDYIEKWYLLYPVRTDAFLIGDHYMPEVCKRNRIITRDVLFGKEFIIENLEDIKRNSGVKSALNKEKSIDQ